MHSNRKNFEKSVKFLLRKDLSFLSREKNERAIYQTIAITAPAKPTALIAPSNRPPKSRFAPAFQDEW